MKAFRKALAIVLTMAMLLSMAAVTFAAEEISFSDVAQDDWFYDSVNRWVTAGVINGKTATTFEPDAPMKRGEFAKVMAEVLGLTGDVEFPFADDKHWADAYVARCYAKGIVNGYTVDGKQYFFAEDEITREQAFAMMVRAMNINAGTEEVLGQFDDAEDVSGWAKEENSTATLITYGAVVGAQGKINPKESITRAEVLKILDRLVGVHVSKEGTVTTATRDTDDAVESGAKVCGIVVVHPACEANVQVSVEPVAVENEEGEIETVNQILVTVTDKEGKETGAELIPTNSSTTTDDEGNEVEEQPIILVTTNIPTKEEDGEETPKQENIPLVPEQDIEISGTTEEKEQIEIEIVPACKHENCTFTPNHNGTHTGTCECGKVLTKACAFLEGGDICYYCGFNRNADARIGDTYYADLASALKAVKEGDTIVLLRDVTTAETVALTGVNLDGNGHTLASSNMRAINISKAVTVKNLTLEASGERGFNLVEGATDVVLQNVTATAANYTVNLTSAAANAVVNIIDCDLTGLNVVNVWGHDSRITITGGTIVCNDQTEVEAYSALILNKDAENATITANGVTFVIKGDSCKAVINSNGGKILIDGSSEENEVSVAYIPYGDYYYSFTDLADALAYAKEGETVILLQDITTDEGFEISGITLDGNGHSITMTKADDDLDSAIRTTGGTFKNLTVTGGFRAIFVANNTASDLVVENCILDSTYALNVTQVNPVEYTLTVTDSQLLGWTSYGQIKSAAFENCTFGEGSTGYAHLRSYVNTELTGCTFEEGFTMDAYKEDRESHTVTLTDCVYGEEKVTAENFTKLALCDLEGDCSLAANAVVTVNGEQVHFLPVANVVESEEYENVELPWGSYGQWSPTAGLDANLEAAYTFSCVDTVEEAQASEYADWYCDFFVKLSKDLGANQIFLGGNYGSFGWVGFHNGELTLPANEEIPLLGSVAGAPWTYADVAANVGTFICGVGDVDNALTGATFTVMLRLTNPENAEEFYNVATVEYTFK